MRTAGPGDVIVWQYAGHGTKVPDVNGDEAQGDSPGQDEAICPVDMLYGFRKSLAAGNLFMAHKMGFTRKTIAQYFLRAGFAAVRAQRDGFDLFALGYRSKQDTDAAPQTTIRLREVLPI